MAATVNAKSYFVEVSAIDADWLWSDDLTGTPNFNAVKFFPGAANDKIVIKEGSATGPVITSLLSADGEQKPDKNISGASRPFIDHSECVNPENALVVFVLKTPIT